MFKDKGLLFVGRKHEENIFIEKVAKEIGWFVEKKQTIPGPTVVYDKKEDSELAKALWGAYKNKDLSVREKFDKLKV